jgi:hypothetical protein
MRERYRSTASPQGLSSVFSNAGCPGDACEGGRHGVQHRRDHQRHARREQGVCSKEANTMMRVQCASISNSSTAA